ncbi:MAG: hypothetical protein ACE5ET_01605 [Gammaproteobacteria bacterium]
MRSERLFSPLSVLLWNAACAAGHGAVTGRIFPCREVLLSDHVALRVYDAPYLVRLARCIRAPS